MATYPQGEALANELLTIAASTNLFPNDTTMQNNWRGFFGEITNPSTAGFSTFVEEFQLLTNELCNQFRTSGFDPDTYATSAALWLALPSSLKAWAVEVTQRMMKRTLNMVATVLDNPWYRSDACAIEAMDSQRPGVADQWVILRDLAPQEAGIGVAFAGNYTDILSLPESEAPGEITTITLQTSGKTAPKNILILAEGGAYCTVTMGEEVLYEPSDELICLSVDGKTIPDDIVITWDRSEAEDDG